MDLCLHASHVMCFVLCCCVCFTCISSYMSRDGRGISEHKMLKYIFSTKDTFSVFSMSFAQCTVVSSVPVSLCYAGGLCLL